MHSHSQENNLNAFEKDMREVTSALDAALLPKPKIVQVNLATKRVFSNSMHSLSVGLDAVMLILATVTNRVTTFHMDTSTSNRNQIVVGQITFTCRACFHTRYARRNPETRHELLSS